jgi:hypothetical protein
MSNTIALQMDNVQRIAIYGILAVIIVLFGAAGALFGILLGAVLMACVLVGVSMVAFVVIGTSLAKLALVAIESFMRVHAGKMAQSATRRMRATPTQEDEPIMAGPARSHVQRTQRTTHTRVRYARKPQSSSYADFVKRYKLHEMSATL